MKDYSGRVGMPGWHGWFERGKRPAGVHPSASVGGPPEHRDWMAGDPLLGPEIHPTALVNEFCVINAGMTYKPTTRIGARTLVMSTCHIGHNARVGDDCELGAHVVVCGEVEIGDRVRIGGSTWIKPLVRIGSDARIGGGSVVTRDVPAGEVWAGNPARPLRESREWQRRVETGLIPAAAESQPVRAVASQPVPPGRLAVGPPAEPQWEHPLRDPEEVWALMAPYHRRDPARPVTRGAALLRAEGEAAQSPRGETDGSNVPYGSSVHGEAA